MTHDFVMYIYISLILIHFDGCIFILCWVEYGLCISYTVLSLDSASHTLDCDCILNHISCIEFGLCFSYTVLSLDCVFLTCVGFGLCTSYTVLGLDCVSHTLCWVWIVYLIQCVGFGLCISYTVLGLNKIANCK